MYPVSYTHLDVYKRQVLVSRFPNWPARWADSETLVTVSMLQARTRTTFFIENELN